MVRSVLIVMWLVGAALTSTAQADSASAPLSLMAGPDAIDMPEAGPILSGRELEGKKWVHSLGEALADPENVYKLSLTNEHLKEIPEEIFRLVNLQVLNLSDNKIKEIPSQISKLANLQVIIFSDNKISVLPESMSELDHVTHLYLARNRIMEMPAWMGGLSKLRRLDLTRNYVTLYDIERTRVRLRDCEVVF